MGLHTTGQRVSRWWREQALTSLIEVGLNIPVSVNIPGLVFLHACRLYLFEAPLRQVNIARSKIAAQNRVSQSKSRREGPNPAPIPRGSVIHNLDFPVVFLIPDGDISVTGDFIVRLRDRSRYGVRVQVTSGLSVNKADDIAVTGELQRSIGIVVGLIAVRVDEPIVVRILVVIASNLLLLGAFRVCLDMRMKKSTTIAPVLNRDAGAKGYLQRTILADLRAFQVSLEKRAHLRISRSTVLEDPEMHIEGEHIDQGRHNNQSDHASNEVFPKSDLVRNISRL